MDGFNYLLTQFKESEGDSPEIRKDSKVLSSSIPEFPLKPYTNDDSSFFNSSIVDGEQLSEDDKIFLEILELSCTGKGVKEIPRKSQVIISNIVNRLDKFQGAAPLHYASINGHISVVKFLLENGEADADIWDGSQQLTPLICAAVHGHLEIVKMLLKHGCNINAGLEGKTHSGSALLWAVKSNQPAVVKCLLNNKCAQYSTVLYSETPVHAAIISGSTPILEMLIAHNESSKLDFQMGSKQDTPLHLAARGEHPNSLEACKLLLEMGNVSVNAVNASGKTALHLAAAASQPEIVTLLLRHCAAVDLQDRHSRTPLFHMISDSSESLDCLEALIFRGKCNVNHQDMYGYTALHLAGHSGAEWAAEILLLGGADFSLKSAGGVSALSMLHRKIPNISHLLNKVFDQAVTIYQVGNPNNLKGSPSSSLAKAKLGRQECKIEVNFKYVLPSPPSSPGNFDLGDDEDGNNNRNWKDTMRISRVATNLLSHPEVDEDEDNGLVRKETAKMKCLVDQGLTELLLHPVVHSFLDMKWQKARHILLPTIFFKVAFVLLFSVYVELPYWLYKENLMKPMDVENMTLEVYATVEVNGVKPPVSIWFEIIYYILITMAALKGIGELSEFFNSPRTQWRSFEHWISLSVLLILIINMKPSWWGRKSQKPYHRSMAALGILLAWIDVWINMSRFPKVGLSIRVFFRVFTNFTRFILPHFCLLAGFVLSFSLLLPGNGEFSLMSLTIAKLVRISAGDITISSEGSKLLGTDAPVKQVVSHFLLVYIYTAFVLMVAIVLMNLLIGLAVNDIQGIYAEASIDKLTKQTILLNTLETNFNQRFIQLCLSKKFLNKFINLFQANSQNKKIEFKPYDSRDQKLSVELKHALLNIEHATVKTITPGGDRPDGSVSSSNLRNWQSVATKLVHSNQGDEHKILMDKINELVSTYLKEKNARNRRTMPS